MLSVTAHKKLQSMAQYSLRQIWLNSPKPSEETTQVIVAKVMDKMKERARNETVSVNRIYSETLQEINSNPKLTDVASILPTLPC